LVYSADTNDDHAYHLAKKINYNPALLQNKDDGYSPVFGIFFRNPQTGRDDDSLLFTYRLVVKEGVPSYSDIIEFVDNFIDGKLKRVVMS